MLLFHRVDRSSPDDAKKMKKKRKPKEKWANAGARKYKEENFDMTPPDVGTFAWLDKELTKIEKEKLRLEREKSKFEERQTRYNSFNTVNINIFFRLTAMKEALCHQPKKEITVKTKAGEEFK